MGQESSWVVCPWGRMHADVAAECVGITDQRKGILGRGVHVVRSLPL